jgi:hypothetical protein
MLRKGLSNDPYKNWFSPYREPLTTIDLNNERVIASQRNEIDRLRERLAKAQETEQDLVKTIRDLNEMIRVLTIKAMSDALYRVLNRE